MRIRLNVDELPENNVSNPTEREYVGLTLCFKTKEEGERIRELMKDCKECQIMIGERY